MIDRDDFHKPPAGTTSGKAFVSLAAANSNSVHVNISNSAGNNFETKLKQFGPTEYQHSLSNNSWWKDANNT